MGWERGLILYVFVSLSIICSKAYFSPTVRFLSQDVEWLLIPGWPIDGTEIIVKDEKEIFERVSRHNHTVA